MPRSTEATKAVAAWYLLDARFLPAMHAVLSGPALIEPFPAGLFANGVTGRSLRLFGTGCDGKLVHGAANWTATTKDADRLLRRSAASRPTTSSGTPTEGRSSSCPPPTERRGSCWATPPPA